MAVAYDSLFGGHLGVKKTEDRIQTNFFWPGLHKGVTSFCQFCDVCQKTVARGSVPRAFLGDMPLISGVRTGGGGGSGVNPPPIDD